jgi:hypothetical protein
MEWQQLGCFSYENSSSLHNSLQCMLRPKQPHTESAFPLSPNAQCIINVPYLDPICIPSQLRKAEFGEKKSLTDPKRHTFVAMQGPWGVLM